MLASPTKLLSQAINQYRQKFFLFQSVYLLIVLPSLFISFLLFVYSRDLSPRSPIIFLIRFGILIFSGIIFELSSHLATYQVQLLYKKVSPLKIYFQILPKIPNYFFTLVLFLPFCLFLFPIIYLPIVPYLLFSKKESSPIGFFDIHNQIKPFFLPYAKYFFTFFIFATLLFWLASFMESQPSLLLPYIFTQLILSTCLTPIGLLYFRLVYQELAI